MARRWAYGSLAVALVLVLPTVAADTREYYGYQDCETGDLIVDDCIIWECAGGEFTDFCVFQGDPCFFNAVAGMWAGRVCFLPYHVGWAQAATVSVGDDVFSPIAAFVCQDDDMDGICGEDGELGEGFCGATVIYEPDWKPQLSVWVFIGGPMMTLKYCGLLGWGTHGIVDHG